MFGHCKSLLLLVKRVNAIPKYLFPAVSCLVFFCIIELPNSQTSSLIPSLFSPTSRLLHFLKPISYLKNEATYICDPIARAIKSNLPSISHNSLTVHIRVNKWVRNEGKRAPRRWLRFPFFLSHKLTFATYANHRTNALDKFYFINSLDHPFFACRSFANGEVPQSSITLSPYLLCTDQKKRIQITI